MQRRTCLGRPVKWHNLCDINLYESWLYSFFILAETPYPIPYIQVRIIWWKILVKRNLFGTNIMRRVLLYSILILPDTSGPHMNSRGRVVLYIFPLVTLCCLCGGGIFCQESFIKILFSVVLVCEKVGHAHLKILLGGLGPLILSIGRIFYSTPQL